MSADNYMAIRADGERFAVTMEFASDEIMGPIDNGKNTAPRFDSLVDAIEYAESQRAEYGYALSPEAKDLVRALEAKARRIT